MKILVTGATGFIGSHLIRVLLKNETNQIIATSSNIKKAQKFDWFPKVTYFEYDLNNSSNNDLFSFFDKPNQLIHLAWDKVSNVKDLLHTEQVLPNHSRFIKNMVAGGLEEIVVTGTCFEYGMINGCLREDLNTNPSNPYGIAKNTLREYIIELKKMYNFRYKWIRVFYIYGKGQSKNSLIYLLDQAIKNQYKQFNMSGGEQLRDYLNIYDVTKYISLIANQNIYIDRVINCCSGKPISVKNLVEQYLKEKGCSIDLNLGYYPYRDFEPMSFWGDRSFLDKILKI
tara:strand:+ start:9 stop:863 length:855 start_codon:yes stop_codon:yes gene_type:complete